MRRKDRELPLEEAVRMLESCDYGLLSCVTNENKPYSVPLNYVYIREENAIYIHCATEGKKLDCISENPFVHFTVVGNANVVIKRFSTEYESAMAEGEAFLVENPDEKRRVLLDLCQKYEPKTNTDEEILDKTSEYIDKHLSKTAIVKIRVGVVTAKSNS